MEGSLAEALGWSTADVLLVVLLGGALAFLVATAVQWRLVREGIRSCMLARTCRLAYEEWRQRRAVPHR